MANLIYRIPFRVSHDWDLKQVRLNAFFIIVKILFKKNLLYKKLIGVRRVRSELGFRDVVTFSINQSSM